VNDGIAPGLNIEPLATGAIIEGGTPSLDKGVGNFSPTLYTLGSKAIRILLMVESNMLIHLM
jgi:hypothetical protein